MNTIVIPEVLLPADPSKLRTWAVNACDQYVSDRAYWEGVAARTVGEPSTYNLIFPEVYLKDGDGERRIAQINRTMNEYLKEGVLSSVNGLILVERTTQSGTRTGIVLAVDLEDYSYERGAKTPVRSTEATILERIPPRVAIRKDAPLELPHVMMLYDDEENGVLKTVKRGRTLYEGDLSFDGGHIKGTLIANPEEVVGALYALCDSARALKKYGADEKLLFAVGDGNHSLATAKICWERLKSTLSEEERRTHPARYALCEAVNLYDPALNFEPIHRYVGCADVRKFTAGLKTSGGERAYIVIEGKKQPIPFNGDIPQGIRELDDYISRYLAENGGDADYIHGEEDLSSATKAGGVGILLPPIAKDDFFRLIISGGNLPRKTFSMGEGNEKRFYIEARKIR